MIAKGLGDYNLVAGGNGHVHNEDIKELIRKSAQKRVVGMDSKTKEFRVFDSISDVSSVGANPKNVAACCLNKRSDRADGSSFLSISTNGWVFMYEKDYSEEELEKKALAALRGKIRCERPIIALDVISCDFRSFISVKEANRLGFPIRRRYLNAEKNKRYCKGMVWAYADIPNVKKVLTKYLINFKKERGL